MTTSDLKAPAPRVRPSGAPLPRVLGTGAVVVLGPGLAILAGAAVVGGSRIALLAIGLLIGLMFAPAFSQLTVRAILLWPIFSVIAYPFVRYPSHHALLTLDRLWLLALIPALVMNHRTRSRTPEVRWVSTVLILYAAAFGLRALLTPGHHLGSIETWFDAAGLPLAVFLFARRYANAERHIVAVLRTVSIAGAIAAAIAVAERLSGFDLSTRAGGAPFDPVSGLHRFSGPFPHPEILAVCLLISLAATFGWAQTRRKTFGGVIVMLLVLNLAGIFLTYFRSAWIGALLVIVVSLGLRPRRFGRLFTIGVVAAAIGGTVAVQIVQDSTALSQRLTNTENVNGRLAGYQQGIALFASHPLAGVGVGQYAAAELALQPIAVNGVKAVPNPHSNYVGIAAEQGLLGIVPYLLGTVVVFLMFRRLVRSAASRTEVALAAALVAAGLAYFFVSLTLGLYVEFEPSAFLALILGLACAQLERTAESPEASPSLRPLQVQDMKGTA